MSELEFLAGAIVLVPLLSAAIPIAATVRWKKVGWTVAASVLSVTLGLAGLLAWEIHQTGRVTYMLAGIDRPFGIELYADEFSMLVVLLTLVISMGVLVYTRVGGPRGNTFYSGFLLLVGGMLGVVITGDIFNMYVFLEIMAIASYALISAAKYRWSTYAAFKYLLVGTVGAGFYLFGVALALAATGTLNMIDLSVRLAEAGYTEPVVIASYVFMGIGLAIKIALFPLHTWLADAHASAPDGISAIISALMPAVALYALARITYTVYTPAFLEVNPVISQLLLLAAVGSLLMGSLFAIIQNHIKLVLAYSTVSQFGIVLMGVAIGNETAIFGTMLHLFGHGIMKASLFLLAGMFALRFGGIRHIKEYSGLAKRAPVLSAAFGVLAVGMIGLPPTVGFAGKWYIALGAFEDGLWIISLLVLGSTLLTAGYLLPFLNRMYFHPFEAEETDPAIITRGMAGIIVVGATLAILLGFLAADLQQLIDGAVTSLVG